MSLSVSTNRVDAPQTTLESHRKSLSPRFWWVEAAVLAGLIGILYARIVAKLVVQWWQDPNFSHGFIIVPFCAYVLWRERTRWRAVPPQPAWFGLVMVVAAMAELVVGVLGSELFLSRSSLLLLLAGLVVYYGGWQRFRAVLFPWAVLFLGVPLPAIIMNQVTLPLQFFASDLASSLLGLLGVPVLQQGNVIQLSSMSLEVVEACSGIRSLVSLITLAVMYGYFLEPSLSVRVVLALVSAPIAVITNGLRIMGTGLMGLYWDPDLAQGFFHEFSGWVIFILSMTLLFLTHGVICKLLQWRHLEAKT